jgi:beta-glucosidase/6-phospho-beta-glucosidase/beta-galactosidase
MHLLEMSGFIFVIDQSQHEKKMLVVHPRFAATNLVVEKPKQAGQTSKVACTISARTFYPSEQRSER